MLWYLLVDIKGTFEKGEDFCASYFSVVEDGIFDELHILQSELFEALTMSECFRGNIDGASKTANCEGISGRCSHCLFELVLASDSVPLHSRSIYIPVKMHHDVILCIVYLEN